VASARAPARPDRSCPECCRIPAASVPSWVRPACGAPVAVPARYRGAAKPSAQAPHAPGACPEPGAPD